MNESKNTFTEYLFSYYPEYFDFNESKVQQRQERYEAYSSGLTQKVVNILQQDNRDALRKALQWDVEPRYVEHICDNILNKEYQYADNFSSLVQYEVSCYNRWTEPALKDKDLDIIMSRSLPAEQLGIIKNLVGPSNHQYWELDMQGADIMFFADNKLTYEQLNVIHNGVIRGISFEDVSSHVTPAMNCEEIKSWCDTRLNEMVEQIFDDMRNVEPNTAHNIPRRLEEEMSYISDAYLPCYEEQIKQCIIDGYESEQINAIFSAVEMGHDFDTIMSQINIQWSPDWIEERYATMSESLDMDEGMGGM